MPLLRGRCSLASRIPFLDTLPLSAFNNYFFLSVVLTCSLLFSVRCRLHLFVLETPMLHLVTSLLIYSYSDSSHRGQYAAYFCSSIRHTEHLWSHFDKTCCNYVPRRCKCHTGFFGDRPRWVLLYLKGGEHVYCHQLHPQEWKKRSNFKIRLFFGLFSLLYITFCKCIKVKGALCDNPQKFTCVDHSLSGHIVAWLEKLDPSSLC